MPSTQDVKHLQIPLQEILVATNGFSYENHIGEGGFGPVYKGTSEKHGRIAVKRLAHGQSILQGDHEFKTEIALLSKYRHENIVSLVGFCDEKNDKILVYKYESNGSLDKHLNNKNLTWIQRVWICIDVGCALTYLHDKVGSQHGIFHRDVKSSNILLDESWKAKISDFGLSRVHPDNMQASFLISNPCGTFGYIDPDYRDNGYLTQKSDVYSFGVVLWEVLCGRLTFIASYTDERRNLAALAKRHYVRKTLHSIIPAYIYKEINKDSLLKFSSIAYQCLKNVEERPTMKQVVEQLQGTIHIQLALKIYLNKCKINKVKGKKSEPVKVLETVKNASQVKLKVRSSEQADPTKLNKKKDKDVKKQKGKKTVEETKLVARDVRKGKELKGLPPPHQLQEFVLGILYHCEGCTDKIKRLKGFQGIEKVDVEKVDVDRNTDKMIIVKGKNANPQKVLEGVKARIRKVVELQSPVAKPLMEKSKKPEQEEPPKHEEKNHELLPSVITVVLNVPMCCQGCVRRIRKCIQKMKGVENAVPDLNSSQVTVKGIISPAELVDYVQKETRKKAVIVEQHDGNTTSSAG